MATRHGQPLPRNRDAHRPLVLVANEPLSYRETLSATLRALRPEAEVLAVEPRLLGPELEGRRPDLVFCSDHTLPAGKQIPVWVDLYPNGEDLAVIIVQGQRSTVRGIGLDGLLSILDQAMKSDESAIRG